jgi:hypothetical protein
MARNNTPAINSLRIGSSYRFFAASASDTAPVHEGDHDQDDDADAHQRVKRASWALFRQQHWRRDWSQYRALRPA